MEGDGHGGRFGVSERHAGRKLVGRGEGAQGGGGRGRETGGRGEQSGAALALYVQRVVRETIRAFFSFVWRGEFRAAGDWGAPV